MRRTLLVLAALFVMFGVLTPAANAAGPAENGDQVVAVDQSQGKWYLRNADGSATSFYYGNPGDLPMFGDWDGDTVVTPGLYRQSDGYVYLRNSNTQGVADIRFFFGNPGDVPIAGDWDGDGKDTVSVFRPSTNEIFIINELGANDGGLGAADYSFTFGDAGDLPLAGDWDGDGIDGIAMYRPSTGQFFWRNALSTGPADGAKFFGDVGDSPIAGDWDGNGADEFGVQRGAMWYLEGVAGSFEFGEAGWFPAAGFFLPQINTGRLNIYETAQAAGTFTTLLAAVDAAGLDGALRGPGPLTVFAPTDDAFAALPAGTVEALLADIPALTRILQYHVVAGEVPASEVVKLDGSYAETIGGELVWVTLSGGKVFLNETTEVIVTDIKASNGIIHVIDAVLIPSDIIETAGSINSSTGEFDTLIAAVTAAGLGDALSAPNGPYTVFAPTDAAFDALPAGVLSGLLADIPALQRVLKYHVASGVVPAADVVALEGSYATTIGNELVWIDDVAGETRLNNTSFDKSDAGLVMTDVKTSNGIIHVIDAVLVPSDTVETATAVNDASGDFDTLLGALTSASLVDALSAPNGPYTVFAPTDDAFAAVDTEVLASIVGNPTALTTVLTYHVIGSVVLAEDVIALAPGVTPATLQGETISVSGTLVLNDPKLSIGVNGSVLGPIDIKTSNGVIHVIDSVLAPQAILSPS